MIEVRRQRRWDTDCRSSIVHYSQTNACSGRAESRAVRTDYADQVLFVFVLFSLASRLAAEDGMLTQAHTRRKLKTNNGEEKINQQLEVVKDCHLNLRHAVLSCLQSHARS